MISEYLGDGAYVKLSDYGELVIYTSNGIKMTNSVVLGWREVDILLEFIKLNKGNIQ